MQVNHTPADMDGDDALELVLDWLSESTGTRLAIVPQWKSIDNSMAFVRIGRETQIETAQTFYKHAGNLREASVALLWPSSPTLEAMHDRRPRRVLVVTWDMETCAGWLHAHQSICLTDGSALALPRIMDLVVEEAMKSLTRFINPRNNLVTYDERDYALQILRALVKAGRKLDPDELYPWALANGWSGRGSHRLMTYASEVLLGKRHVIHRGSPQLQPGAIEHWIEASRSISSASGV